MKWGIDQWSRYVEFNGERYNIEDFRFWPLRLSWRVSKYTGIGWGGHEADRVEADE